jgi:hypothetical protein
MVPCVSANVKTIDDEKLQEISEALDTMFESKAFKMLERIHRRLVGEEAFEQTYNDILELLKEAFPLVDPPYYDVFERLAIWSTIIVDFTMLLLGHNPIGLLVGYVFALVVSTPIILIFDFMWSLDFVLDLVGEFFPTAFLSIDELIEIFGIIGFVVIAVLLVPATFVVIALCSVLTVIAMVPGYLATLGMWTNVMNNYYSQNPPW